MSDDNDEHALQTFRALVESSDRKFARVRDAPTYGHRGSQGHLFQKVFKAYTRLWKFQQDNRAKLVRSGLNRWEIGEIASRIGQLYFSQYMRTSESRFLIEAYVFYEAILSRRYFQGSEASSPKDLGVRSKELRFYARFLLVSLILNRFDMVKHLMDQFVALIDDCRSNFRETNFKEWKQVVQEIVRFTKVDKGFSVRPMRYCATIDTHRASLPYVARFHAKRVLKFHDALLTSYHRNEVKFAELTLDTYRMIQCLEWEPRVSFLQRHTVIKPNENGELMDHSVASGIIDLNLAADMTDPTMPPNPRKATLYRPTITRFMAVMATICEELPPDSVVLVYLSASGKAGLTNVSQMENSGSGVSSKYSRRKVFSQTSHEQNSGTSESLSNGKSVLSCDDNYLWFGPKGNGGSNNLYPGDLIPFTRKPLFLIVDSDNSHAFKVLHGAERGETAALFLSPLRPLFKNPSDVNLHNGSQFTFFLTSPLSAFCQMIGLFPNEADTDIYSEAENILTNAFTEWEIILCSTTSMDLVWAQMIGDPFLRRLILRFIFCRSVVSFLCPPEESEQYLPFCLPHLPNSVAPKSEAVRSAVMQLAGHFDVADSFYFTDT
ncbi:PREDICTED: protein SCAI-like [Lupinus angustifolius]|uniref:protein SCAI-like n=1 Tax=Lupinus angustifolius TaxID=3871 RepID=UPI00092F99F2|nr:PREDICTED: protein SCAI-like [Lupinus angustifolius]